jgi:hypothetical protein
VVIAAGQDDEARVAQDLIPKCKIDCLLSSRKGHNHISVATANASANIGILFPCVTLIESVALFLIS